MTEALRGHLAMLCFSAVVAGSFSLGRMAVPFIAPEAFNAVRFLVAAVVVMAVMLARGGASRAAWKAPWRYVVLAGLFAFYFVTMFTGLETAEPVSLAAVFTLSPILAGGFGWLLMRQITTPRMALALSIGGAGALWVVFRGDLTALSAFRIGSGEVIYFWGCVAHALYVPMVRLLNRGEPALVFNAGMLVAGACLMGIYAAPEIMATDWLALPGIVWITIVYTALAATSLTFALIRYSTMRLPSAKVMAYTYLTPCWVLIWEISLGHGTPPGRVLAGVALTLVALVLLLKDEDPVAG
ncbi:DMT family transporter [Puniceibacterium sediminis]|uniref:EamA-like transporter family protein n=1 Tax=Puniceibacterium sediminis TaxID=1608407 RepID=A0A238Y4Z0_9RHOB|nr:DMT family transporter [Puniceibacterium sediminis]SNR65733.1 EamA-like transporter family protein [Puniceibacterium sediminis]